MNDRAMIADEVSLAKMPALVTQHIGSLIEKWKDKASYAITCSTINSFFQPDLEEIGLEDYWTQ